MITPQTREAGRVRVVGHAWHARDPLGTQLTATKDRCGAEADRYDDPRNEHAAEVIGRPGTETADGPDASHRGHPRSTWSTRSITSEAGQWPTETNSH